MSENTPTTYEMLEKILDLLTNPFFMFEYADGMRLPHTVWQGIREFDKEYRKVREKAPNLPLISYPVRIWDENGDEPKLLWEAFDIEKRKEQEAV